MPPTETLRSSRSTEDSSSADRDTEAKRRRILDQVQKHVDVSYRQLKVASRTQTEDLLRDAATLKNNDKQVDEWDTWFIDWSRKALASAKALYEDFKSTIDREIAAGHISRDSKEKWMSRFMDESVSYKEKEYWIKHQFPHFVANWKKTKEERDTILKDPRLEDAIRAHPALATIKDKERFLSLHFDDRKGLLAEARAAMKSSEGMEKQRLEKAKTILKGAVSERVLHPSKVGTWLERIATSNSPSTLLAALPGLVSNWANVKGKYDACMKKARERGEDDMPRGIRMLSESEFLKMHFTQREHYVQELKDRLDDAKNVATERPIFLKIRHAIDLGDMDDAVLFIAEAKADPTMDEKGRARLASMEHFVKSSGSKSEKVASLDKAMDAKKRIDSIVGELSSTHSEVIPMVLRLLRGPHGNRSIHQLRWIAYNNKWCRSHGYLNDSVARKGASKENAELTKERAERGEDIGRHDVISYHTDNQKFIRKNEYANHKATYRHINMKDGHALTQTAEWLEREQDPKVLYWTTFCAHDDGDPKSANWHNDFFHHLTELRSLTRTVNGSGFMYDGPGRSLIGKN